MKKVFVVSWFFPPVNAAEAIVTFKLLKESKYKYDVYSHCVNDRFTFVQESRLKSDNIKTITSNVMDHHLWIENGYQYFMEHATDYSCIMSRCMPRESHEVALKIKKKYKNIKWIASFSDPLAYSPYTKLIEETNPYNDQTGFKNCFKSFIWNLRRLRYRLFSDPEIKNRRIQKRTLKIADKIILNNEYQKQFILSKYKKLDIENKICIIPHSYDSSFYKQTDKFYKDKIVISYLGHLDEYRNAYNFLEALNRLYDEDSGLKDKIEVRFYGNICDKDKLYIFNNGLYDIVKIFKPISYFDSLSIMSQSDYLLSIDANLLDYIDKNIFFASKIVDYMGSKSNIFCITMEKGPTIDILKDYGAIVCNFDVDDIYMNIKKIINTPKNEIKVNWQEQFDNKIVSCELDKILTELESKNYD